MGAHHPRHAAPGSRQRRRLALAVITPVAVVTLACMIWLWPSEGVTVQEQSAAEQFKGEATAILREDCAEQFSDDVNGCGTAQVRMVASPEQGSVLTLPLPNGPGAPEIAVDDNVVLIKTINPDGEVYAIVDHQRSTEFWMLAAAFVLALVVFGRWRGLTDLAGLA